VNDPGLAAVILGISDGVVHENTTGAPGRPTRR
jgi:hypothetical protein